MKRILIILSALVMLYSCQKKERILYPPITLTAGSAIDSMHIEYGQIYHMVLEDDSELDSSRSLRFNYYDSVTEYYQYSDVFGDHVDSVSYGLRNGTRAAYHQPNPSDYNTTIGFVYLNYYPSNFTANGFAIHDLHSTDSMVFTIGANTKHYAPTAYFRSATAGSTITKMRFGKKVVNGNFFN